MYVTIEEAEEIQSLRLGTEVWDQVDEDSIKLAALTEAERLLNYHVKWLNLEINEFNEIITDPIPSQIKRGVTALAQLLIEDSDIESNDFDGITSFEVSSISVSFAENSSSSISKNPIPDSIISYLYPYGRKKIKTRQRQVLVRG